ncbi:MAG: fumarylacetoacetate hydrolase family protein, partial [Candidatus Omnitrophica bacterium]|nr:fumarylacetoacetate hydrolase family protein [Candidatus Omnitrophota bacterium]
FGAAGNMRPKDAEPAPKPDHPEFFFKAATALVPQGGEIVIPKDAEKVLYEGEVVVVIGKEAKKVSVEEAPDYILGITCGNDVSGSDWGGDFQAWRVKATDTFAPCGPFLVTGLDYNNLDFELRLNGEVRQKANTCDLIHSIPELVSFLSQYITLRPGDLIYAGTQPPVDVIKPGDTVEVEVEGVGVLKNQVVADKD